MKLKKLTRYTYPAFLAVSLSMACATANAATSASAFEGAYGQIATGYWKNSQTQNNYQIANGSPQSVTLSSSNANATPAIIGLGYNFAVAPSWVLGLGADYNLTSSKQNDQYYNPQFSGGPLTGNITTKNQLNIFVAPGYEITSSSLLYAKVGYASAKYNTDVNENGNLSGYILGLGYKMKIVGSLYGYVEGNYINYSKSTYSAGTGVNAYSFQVGGNNYNALLGVGYQF